MCSAVYKWQISRSSCPHLQMSISHNKQSQHFTVKEKEKKNLGVTLEWTQIKPLGALSNFFPFLHNKKPQTSKPQTEKSPSADVNPEMITVQQ